MRFPFVRRTAALALALLLPAAAAAEEAWCEACGDWFPKPGHEAVHGDPAAGNPVTFCEACDAWVPAPHARHLFESGDAAGAGNGGASAGAGGGEEEDDGVPGLLRGFRPWMLAVPAAAVLFVFFLRAWIRAGRAGRASGPGPFPSRRELEEDGVVLLPGTLVCERKGLGDGGGSSTGHRAWFLAGGEWTRAFVKRARLGAQLAREQLLPQLEFEAGILASLADTGVVPHVFAKPAVASAGGEEWPYFAMSLAPGGPWPESGGLGRDTHRALYALCDALVKLHERGIGHHDLKPQNVFWDPERGRVTLIDFGSAIDHAGNGRPNPLAGKPVGTPPWVPPHWDGQVLADFTTAADAWVYGLLFCEALVGGVRSGARHWFANPRNRTADRIERDWFREALAGVEPPQVVEAVVDGLFAREPAGRMALSDFLQVLQTEWRTAPGEGEERP